MNDPSGYTVGTPHPTATDADIKNLIREALAQAAALDDAARNHRRKAGRLLAEARSQHPDHHSWILWIRDAQLDVRGADLLVELHAGAKPHGHAR